MRAPRLIARNRRSAAHRGTWHALSSLFCFCRPPSDSALGYWVLFSGSLPPPSPSSCCSPPSPPPGQLPALFPSTLTAWTRRTELYPGYARCTFARADTTYRVISLFRAEPDLFANFRCTIHPGFVFGPGLFHSDAKKKKIESNTLVNEKFELSFRGEENL